MKEENGTNKKSSAVDRNKGTKTRIKIKESAQNLSKAEVKRRKATDRACEAHKNSRSTQVVESERGTKHEGKVDDKTPTKMLQQEP